MNDSEKKEIQKLLKNRAYLLCEALYARAFKQVKSILEMPEWKDEKFKGLLGSRLWLYKVEDIEEKIRLKCWKDKRYEHLLKMPLLNLTEKNIVEGIELLEEYNISQYVTTRCLRRDVGEQRSLIEYMISNNIPLVIKDYSDKRKQILNPILNASTSVLKERYKIDIKNIKEIKKKDEDLERI